MLDDQRQTGPIWLAAGDVPPDEGEPAEISVDTAIRGQSVRLSSLPGGSSLLNARFGAYRSSIAAKVAVHRGNPGIWC
jgi:hypothetical protein